MRLKMQIRKILDIALVLQTLIFQYQLSKFHQNYSRYIIITYVSNKALPSDCSWNYQTVHETCSKSKIPSDVAVKLYRQSKIILQ